MKKIITGCVIFLCSCILPAQNSPQKKNDFNQPKDTNELLKLLDTAKSLRYSNYDAAAKLCELAKAKSFKMEFWRGEALAYSLLASIHYNKGDIQLAEKFGNVAVNKLRTHGTRTEYSDGLNRLGLIYMVQAKYYQAAGYFRQSLAMSTALKDTAGSVIATHNLGVVSFYKSEFDKTALYYNQSLRLAEKIHDKTRINTNLLNLGLLYDTQKAFAKAKLYIRRALKNYEAANDLDGMASAWQGLGTTLFNEQLFDSSLIAHQNALNIYENLGKLDGLAHELCNIADIFVQQKQFEKAKEYYLKSVAIRKENGDKHGLILSYTGLANTNYSEGHTSRAQLYFDSALVLSRQVGSPMRTAEVYMFISDFHAGNKNYQAAYDALKHYSLAKDTLLSSEKTRLVHELEAQYENEKKEQDLQNKQNEIRYLKKSNRLFTWLLILSGLVALLIVLLLINRSRQIRRRSQEVLQLEKKDHELVQAKKKELEMELEFKKKELTQLALHISSQNEFLVSFKNSLKEASGERDLKTLERELESKIVLDKQREAFEMNIDLIHQDFFRKLKERFPTLTENEKKLCAMLRLNLSSKEIASIQNISVKSVEMNRYRLRKKIHLAAEEELVSFLSHF